MSVEVEIMVRSIKHLPCIDDLLEELNLSPETRKSVEKFVFFFSCGTSLLWTKIYTFFGGKPKL